MKPLRLLPAIAVLLLGAFVVGHSLWSSWQLLPLVPYLDHLYLQDVFFIEAANGNEGAFWHRLTPSNEHLMLVPMPLYWLDNELFLARGTLLVAVIQLVNLSVACVLARMAAAAFGWSRLATAAALLLFAASQFWGLHGVNLFWPKQVHMYCMLAAFAGAAWAYARAEQVLDWRLFALSVLCCFASLFSFGYGIAACCGLLGVAVWRAPWRWSAALLALLAAGFWFYWQHMLHPPREAISRPTGLAWLQAAIEYGLYFLSSPVVQLTGQLLPANGANLAALLLTGAGVAGALAFLTLHLLRRSDLPPARTFAAVWLLAAVTGAAITAVARLGNDPVESRADRYAMIPVAFWNALLLAGLSWLPARWRARALFSVGVAVLPLLLLSHLQQMHLNRIGRCFIRTGEMAVLNQVDDAALAIVHPNYQTHLPRVQAGMRQRQWGIFAGPQDEWLGRPLAQVFATGTARVRGFVQTVVPATGSPGAVRVGGWAMDDGGDAPDWLVLVDGGGVIAGVAHRLGLPAMPAGSEPAMAPLLGLLVPGADPALDASGFWVGYARTAEPQTLVPYAVLPGGAAVPLAK